MPSSTSKSLLEGEIHYLPLYKGREIQDLSEVDKEDREKFMRNSLLKLIRAFYNFIEFIEKHPDTQVAKIQVFVGETFNEMAQLMKKELEINLTESNDPDLGIIYSFKISIQELKEGLEKFRRNHTEIYNRVKKSSLIKDNRIDFGKPKNF